MRPLRSFAGDFKLGAVFSQQWFLGSHNHKPIRVSYLSLLQSQEDSLHHNMACIIYLSLSIYIHTVNLAADGTRAQSEHLETPIE